MQLTFDMMHGPPLVGFTRAGAARTLRHPQRVCITDPRVEAGRRRDRERRELEVREAEAPANIPYWSGTLSFNRHLRLWPASVPCGHKQRFLGYWPQQEMAERSIREHEQRLELVEAARSMAGPKRRTAARPVGRRGR